MLFDSFQWTYYLPGDEYIDIESLLVGDTLLSGLTLDPAVNQSWSTSVYPNPARTTTTIRINSSVPGHFNVSIYDIQGKLINELPPAKEIYGSYFTSWNGDYQNGDMAPSGIYFFKIESDYSHTVGKLIWMPVY
jgi:hypothetical protein